MKGKKRKNRKRYNFFLVILILVLLLAVYMLNELTEAASEVSREVRITIPAGSSNQEIARILAEHKIIKNKFAFLLYSKYLGYDRSLKAGSYELDPSWDLVRILEELKKGQVRSTTFTIPEGYTIEQIAERLSKNGLVNKEKFLSLTNSPQFELPFLEGVKNEGYLLEGYLFPDTYQVAEEMDEADIIRMMLNRFTEVYDEPKRDKAKKMGLTDHELITIASMIEKEAKYDQDRALIASVIYNRLQIGMPLQIDATIQFALETHKAKLKYKDLEVESPYNTYKILGLPPGPIGAPGKASIVAALYPKETDFLYYLAKQDGTHVFSRTLEEHNAAKQKYLK
ncbi:MAG: endolytic transglycosylase MltG [Zhaonellaceae bacterium]|jgi:UPF0755 protein|nr:endolytic transglycosylase MltG [Clostridia bacterium]